MQCIEEFISLEESTLTEIPAYLQQPDKTLFFDIETTGLSPRASSLYLIGTIYYDSEKVGFYLTQWFADNYHSEAPIISAFLDQLEQFDYLYHYNGATFDIPYVLHKCHKHDIAISDHCAEILERKNSIYSVDMLKHVRKLKKIFSLSGASQKAVENWLGIYREDMYSGRELISVYSEYMQSKILNQSKANSLKDLLLLHNHDDILGMLEVGNMLLYRNLFTCPEQANIQVSSIEPSVEYSENFQNENSMVQQVMITFRYDIFLPKDVVITRAYQPEIAPDLIFHLELSGQQGTLILPVLAGTKYHFLKDYKNYYYLPAEDCAMHKSVAEFVDPSHRQKATAKTCYIKKTGNFIPVAAPKKWEEAMFLDEYAGKPAYVEFTDSSDTKKYTKLVINHLYL